MSMGITVFRFWLALIIAFGLVGGEALEPHLNARASAEHDVSSEERDELSGRFAFKRNRLRQTGTRRFLPPAIKAVAWLPPGKDSSGSLYSRFRGPLFSSHNFRTLHVYRI
jgi:hypothetical protein